MTRTLLAATLLGLLLGLSLAQDVAPKNLAGNPSWLRQMREGLN